MPNHVHGTIWIKPVGAGLALPNNKLNINRSGPRPAPTLGDIMCAFKSKTAVNINRYRNTPGASIWQRNYYEHIIRNEESLKGIREYIIYNPLKWEDDIENPLNLKKGKAKDYYDGIFDPQNTDKGPASISSEKKHSHIIQRSEGGRLNKAPQRRRAEVRISQP